MISTIPTLPHPSVPAGGIGYQGWAATRSIGCPRVRRGGWRVGKATGAPAGIQGTGRPIGGRAALPTHTLIPFIPLGGCIGGEGYAGTRDYTRGCGGQGSLWGSGYRVPAYTLTYRPGVVWSEKKAEGG